MHSAPQTADNTEQGSRIRVWWIPQVPMTPFLFDVPTLEAGAMLCDALARYDLFQFEHRVKPDFANSGGIEIADDDGEWMCYDPDDDDDMAEARAIIASRSAVSP